MEYKLLLLQILESESNVHLYVQKEDVEKYINQLKNNKAPDVFGITSEHIKLADDVIIKLLTTFLQNTCNNKQLTTSMKLGVITPVPKKDKNKTSPNSYRRITVTPVTGKLVEKSMLKEATPVMDEVQNRLQRGFSSKCSSANAAFLVTEAIAEAKDNKEPIILQFLDARKAFDVVWHTGLLCTLHDQGITGPTWQLFNVLYCSEPRVYSG